MEGRFFSDYKGRGTSQAIFSFFSSSQSISDNQVQPTVHEYDKVLSHALFRNAHFRDCSLIFRSMKRRGRGRSKRSTSLQFSDNAQTLSHTLSIARQGTCVFIEVRMSICHQYRLSNTRTRYMRHFNSLGTHHVFHPTLLWSSPSVSWDR